MSLILKALGARLCPLHGSRACARRDGPSRPAGQLQRGRM